MPIPAGVVGIYNSSWKGTFRLEKRKDGYYNIKNTYDNNYMYMHTDGKPYINSDGKPDNANAQWRIDGMPEPYLADGPYEIGGSQFELRPNTDAIILSVPYQALATYITLERQPEGSYTIKMYDGYVRSNSKDQVLSVDKTGGSKFYLDKQAEGRYFIRGEDGLYWRSERTVDRRPLRQDATPNCGIDLCNPVISGPNEGRRQELGCDDQAANQCKQATPIGLRRDWR